MKGYKNYLDLFISTSCSIFFANSSSSLQKNLAAVISNISPKIYSFYEFFFQVWTLLFIRNGMKALSGVSYSLFIISLHLYHFHYPVLVFAGMAISFASNLPRTFNLTFLHNQAASYDGSLEFSPKDFLVFN